MFPEQPLGLTGRRGLAAGGQRVGTASRGCRRLAPYFVSIPLDVDTCLEKPAVLPELDAAGAQSASVVEPMGISTDEVPGVLFVSLGEGEGGCFDGRVWSEPDLLA